MTAELFTAWLRSLPANLQAEDHADLRQAFDSARAPGERLLRELVKELAEEPPELVWKVLGYDVEDAWLEDDEAEDQRAEVASLLERVNEHLGTSLEIPPMADDRLDEDDE